MTLAVDKSLTFRLPVRVISEANAHTHWRVRATRAKRQRGEVKMHLYGVLRGRTKPRRITLTRLSPRRLDSDNLSGAFKHVRDEIAALLGFDDRDESVEWKYAQEQSKQQGCYVKIEW